MQRPGSNAPRPIIVKKIVVEGHGGHHGGAWKVAYADFVTAMMAFFLLMWLLGATTEKQRKALADYFAPTMVPSKQDTAGSDSFFGGDSIVSADKYPHQAGQTGTRSLTIPRDAKGGPKEGLGRDMDRARFNTLKTMLERRMKADKALKQLGKAVRFTETRDGLRIDLVDEADFAMFVTGTDTLTPPAVSLLQAVSEVLRVTPNLLIIRGHTDATPWTRNPDKNNWQLSVMRAERTRLFLTGSGGLPEGQIARIEGVAEREPHDSRDPFAGRNRRMSITLGWSIPGETMSNSEPTPPSGAQSLRSGAERR